MSAGRVLAQRLLDDRVLVLPGAANAVTARIVQEAGFEAVYVTGAGVANTFLGVPDIGLLTLDELARHVAAIRDVVDIPVIVDADTGFGNALNVRRTVMALERAGANAIQLEDQTFPKRCGHFSGKDVIERDEMVQKIHAAVDARPSTDLLIVARTDARAVLGIDAACERAIAYRDAGADIQFVEAPSSREEIEQIARDVPGPKILNLVHGGVTPHPTVTEMQEAGFSIALYANLALLASIHATRSVLTELLHQPQSITTGIATWDERQDLVGLGRYRELEARYAVPGDVKPG